MTLYTFEGEGADDTYSTPDINEAREYAKRYHLAILANEYEWVDDELIEDYRLATDPTRIEDES